MKSNSDVSKIQSSLKDNRLNIFKQHGVGWRKKPIYKKPARSA